MNGHRAPIAWWFLVTVCFTEVTLGAEEPESSAREVLELEKEFLVVHEKAPLDLRRSLLRRFQQRITATPTLKTLAKAERDAFYRDVYDSLRKSFRLEEDDAHDAVREHLGQQNDDERIEEFAAEFREALGSGGDPETLRRKIEALRKRKVLRFRKRDSTKTLEDQLKAWVGLWTPDTLDAKTLETDLRLLKNVMGMVANDGLSVSGAVKDVAIGLADACLDSESPGDRRRLLVKLNPCLDEIRRSGLVSTSELQKEMVTRFAYTARKLKENQLTMDLASASENHRADRVTGASLASINYRDPKSSQWLSEGIVLTRTETENDGDDYYLLPITDESALHLVYLLEVGGQKRKASVVLRRDGDAGVAVKPDLPRILPPGRVYVYDSRMFDTAYLVDSSSWSRCRVVKRLVTYYGKATPEEHGNIRDIWNESNLKDLRSLAGGSLREALTVEGNNCGNGETEDGPFLLSITQGSLPRSVKETLIGAGGLVDQQSGERLPARSPAGELLIGLLLEEGELYEFELGGVSALLNADADPVSRDSEAVKTTGVCTVLPLEAKRRSP